MERTVCCSLMLAVTLCCIDDAGVWLGNRADAQIRPAPWEHPTPQRMCVGMIRDGKLIGQEVKRVTDANTKQEYDVFDWFLGDLASSVIAPYRMVYEEAMPQSHAVRNRTSNVLRRWCWRNGCFWFACESMYGPIGPFGSGLWRTETHSQNGPATASALDASAMQARQDLRLITETCTPVRNAFSDEDRIERVSRIEPLTRSVEARNMNGKIGGSTDFFHPNDGFDIVPHALNQWTLVMSVSHTMQIWVCQSRRVILNENEQIQNTWTLTEQFWVPWRGQFFVIEVAEPRPWRPFRKHVLVRDCGEVFDLQAYDGKWQGQQLLAPSDYLIALLYVEPDNGVYGFGPNFYVRLDAPTASLEKTHCRDVTVGKASWTDEKGQTHELGEPFRTIWQCANVLKEDGVLEAATETETKAEGP